MAAMDPHEMSVVISRAAELHANIDAAIDRSLNHTSWRHSRHTNSQDLVEARSLASIRDALEVLEEQLACLQTLQRQQRAEKDATLAELEESKEIFIRRLKQHRGREWKVISDALSFAGEPEPLLEKDDLSFPPYPMQLATDPAAFAKLDVPISSFARNLPAHENVIFKHFDFTDEEVQSVQGIYSGVDEGCEMMDGSEREEGSTCHKDGQRPFVANGCLFRGLKNRLFRFFKGRIGKASGKAFLLLAGAAAVTYGRQRSVGGGRSTFVAPRMSTELWQNFNREACSPGRWSNVQDGVQKHMEREQIEILSKEAVCSTDVSHRLG